MRTQVASYWYCPNDLLTVGKCRVEYSGGYRAHVVESGLSLYADDGDSSEERRDYLP